jgi:hypothetical protein
MSTPATGVVVPTKGGEPIPGAAAAATPMTGGMMLSPLPLGGGGKKKRLSKKTLKALKKMTPKQLKKLMKGGEGEDMMTETAPETPAEGAARRRRRGSRKTRRGSRKSRRSGLLY